MHKQITVGIPLFDNKAWPAGAAYAISLAKALTGLPEKLRPKLYLVAADQTLAHFPLYQAHLPLFAGLIYTGKNPSAIRSMTDQPVIHCRSRGELRKIIVHYYPEDASIQRIFQSLPLCLFPDAAWYLSDPQKVKEKYALPDKFVFCHNPYWFQAGHLQLFEAIAALRKTGTELTVVCTGFTNHDRCPEYFQEFRTFINNLGISHLVHFLDPLPEQDHIQLIRRSLFVIEPAGFAGLDLLIRQCQALGKPILLPADRCLKNPPYGLAVQNLHTQDLAGQLAMLVAVCKPGPDTHREAEAQITVRHCAAHAAETFAHSLNRPHTLKTKLLKLFKPSPVNSDTLTIATSIAPHDLADQIRAITSWLDMGFNVVSLNRKTEAQTLKKIFPAVEFIVPPRTAEEKYKKPLIYLDDLLRYFKEQARGVCGIVNSDIHFRNKAFYQFVAREAAASLVYGARVNISSPAEHAGEWDPYGFDYFFFDTQLLSCLPPSEYCLGLPWWDFWLPLTALGYRLPVKKIITPHAFHVTHHRRYDDEILYELGYSFAKQIPPPFTLNHDTMPAYGSWLRNIMRKCSTEITFAP